MERKKMPQKTNHVKNKTNEASTGPKVVEVTFALQCAEAKEVYLCGDFNNWSPAAARMIPREGNGRWEKRLILSPGRYEYKFIVDGEWTADPAARQDVVNTFGSVNSVVEVRL